MSCAAVFCARCSCEIGPAAVPVLVRTLAILDPDDVYDLPESDPDDLRDEWNQLMRELRETSAREASEDVVATRGLHLCQSCFSVWSWVRLREMPRSVCALCDRAIDRNSGEPFRAGFMIASSLAADEAHRIFAGFLMQLADRIQTIGPDDIVAFRLCHGCKAPWIEDPFDDRDWPP